MSIGALTAISLSSSAGQVASGWFGNEVLYAKQNCTLEEYMRRNKIGTMAQPEAYFPPSQRMLQRPFSNKYREGGNDDTLHLKRLCQCALLSCSVKYEGLETRICEKNTSSSAVALIKNPEHLSAVTVSKSFSSHRGEQCNSVNKF